MSHEASPIIEADVVDPKIDFGSPQPQGLPCESCGSPVERMDHFCAACGRAQSSESTAASPGVPATDAPQQRLLRCENCGSEVALDATQRSYTCPFCDSNYVAEFSRASTGRHQPEFVIGFAITPEDARQKFHEWIRSNAWFRPRDLPRAAIAEKMRGVYLPFWSFSMLANSSWSASIGEYWYRTETYTTTDSKGKTVTRTRQVRETEWWPLGGRHHRYYSGYLVSGSRGLPQQDADQIKPFNLPAIKRYQPYFLAGWLAEEYSVAQQAALEISQDVFLERERANVAAFLPGDTYRHLELNTTFSHINADLCLLPAYILSYQYREKLYRFLVNGQTGKISGAKPVSAWRITIAVLVVILLIVAVAVTIALVGRLGQ